MCVCGGGGRHSDTFLVNLQNSSCLMTNIKYHSSLGHRKKGILLYSASKYISQDPEWFLHLYGDITKCKKQRNVKKL